MTVRAQEEGADGPSGQEPGGSLARRWGPIIAAGVVVLAGLGVALWLFLGSSSPVQLGPEGVPLQSGPALGSADSTASGATVDGITCRTAADQIVKYHIHTLVEIFVNGNPVHIPAGAGMPAGRLVEHLPGGVWMDNALNGCLYWLHVHTTDGIVHVEAPYKGTFTLGEFFDVWQQPLSTSQVGPARGRVVGFENGRQISGDPRALPLLNHAVIQLDVGSPVVSFRPMRFNVNDLCGSATQSCAAG